MIDLELIFNSILSGSNEERNQALENYQNLVAHQPNEVLRSLVHTYTHSSEERFRSISVIYLKKLIISQGCWDNLTSESKEIMKNSLFEILKHESSHNVRSQIHDTIAELFVFCFKKNEWTDVLDKLSELISSPSDYKQREAGLLILGHICSMEPILMRQHLEVLRDLSAIGLEDSSLSVQMSTLVALTGFISATRTKNLRKTFQSLIPNIINVLTTALNNSKLHEAFSIIQIFHDWVDIDPLFFKPYLTLLSTTLLEICRSNVDEDLTDQAVLLLSSLISIRTKDMLSIDGFLREYISILMNLLLRMDDYTVEEWNRLKENERTTVSQSERVETSIDSLSLAVGGEVLLPHILEYIQSFVQNPDWKYRHSGIMALGLIIEGCKPQFLLSLHDIVNLVVNHMRDPHPRVRWVATFTLGSISSDLSPKIQRQFPHLILPVLAERLDETDFPKIQKIALIALRTFCSSIEKSVLLQYLDDLLKKLYTMLSSDDKEILEECVSAIAAVANKAEENFINYYDTFIPYIKMILNNTQDPKYRLLRAKTFECITFIGIAVGKEKFLPDAHEILSHLQQTEISEFGSDDSNSEFLLESAARICEVLKEDFIQYLPMVMPLIFKLATIDESDYINEYDEFPDNDEGYKYRFIDGKKVGFHTATLQIKSLALQMLCNIITTLNEGLSEYYFTILNIILPLLSFYFYKEIRATTTSMLYPLLKSMCKTFKSQGNLEEFLKIFNSVLNELIGAFIEETDIDIQALMCATIAECISVLPEGMLSRDQTENIVKIMLTVVKEFDTFRNKRIEEYHEEYDDEADDIIREREEDELNVLCRIAEIGGVLSRNQINTYLPVFESNLNFVMELIEPNNYKCNRYLGFTLLDDAIENSNGALDQLIPHCLPLMIDALADDDVDLVQSACIGVGISAQRGGEHFSQYLEVALKSVAGIFERDDFNDDEVRRDELRDTAACAFGKILAFQHVNRTDLFTLWLSWLPLTAEPLDARECHKILAEMVEQNNTYLWGEYYNNLPKILEIFSFCVSEKAKHYVLPETAQKIYNIIGHMKNDNSELFNQALQTLDASNQEILNNLFKS